MLWRYNQMTVEQVRREDAKTAVCGGKLAGKQKLVNLKYSQISKNIKIKLYH